MTTKDQAIAPCPFCGHAGDLDFHEGSTFRWLAVECAQCCATCGEVRVQTMGEGTRDEWIANAKQEGIDLWNTRPTAPDCRTCTFFKAGPALHADKCYRSFEGCTNGDQYQPAPKLVLWRTT